MKNILKFVFIYIFFISVSYASSDEVKTGLLYKKIFTSKKEAKVALNIWKKQFPDINNPLDVEATLYESEKRLLDDFLNNRISAFISDATFYYKNRKVLEKNMHYKWIMSRSKNKFEQFYLLKNRNSKIDYENLNKNVNIYYKADLARTWFETILYKKNKKKNYNFEKQEKAKKLIFNPFFNKNDISIVGKDLYDSMVDLNPQIKEKLEIIRKSKPIFFRAIGLTRKGLNKETYLWLDKLAEKLNKKEDKIKAISFLKLSSIYMLEDNEVKDLDTFFKEYFKQKSTK